MSEAEPRNLPLRQQPNPSVAVLQSAFFPPPRPNACSSQKKFRKTSLHNIDPPLTPSQCTQNRDSAPKSPSPRALSPTFPIPASGPSGSSIPCPIHARLSPRRQAPSPTFRLAALPSKSLSPLPNPQGPAPAPPSGEPFPSHHRLAPSRPRPPARARPTA